MCSAAMSCWNARPRASSANGALPRVAGDRVTVEGENGGNVIAEIAPRRNVFVRPPIANLDVLFIVASTTQPVPSTLVLDKLTAIAVDKEVQPVLVFTKGEPGQYRKADRSLCAVHPAGGGD